MRALIVDDEPINLKIIEKLWSKYGKAFSVGSGKEALDAFEAAATAGKPFDVIFLDIMMPEVDGHEVLEKIRKLEEEHDIDMMQGVKIIMTTAHDDAKTVMSSFKSGCEGYLVKPIDPQKFIDLVVKLDLSEVDQE